MAEIDRANAKARLDGEAAAEKLKNAQKLEEQFAAEKSAHLAKAEVRGVIVTFEKFPQSSSIRISMYAHAFCLLCIQYCQTFLRAKPPHTPVARS